MDRRLVLSWMALLSSVAVCASWAQSGASESRSILVKPSLNTPLPPAPLLEDGKSNPPRTAPVPSLPPPATALPSQAPYPGAPEGLLPPAGEPFLVGPDGNLPPGAGWPSAAPVTGTPPTAVEMSPRIPAAVESEVWLTPFDWTAWLVPDGWDGSFEVGINGTEGNAQAFSFRTGGNLKRKIAPWEYTADIIYAKTTADSVETQHNAIFNAGYERSFGDTAWSHFGKTNLEYDEFKAFDLRVALNAGMAYKFLATDSTSFKGRFGAGTSHEINGPDDRWVPEAVFGADYSWQISKLQKLTLTSDYFPEWQNFNSYRVVTNFGWEMILDEASHLNLKLSVNDRYDSTPNGRRPNDVIYSLLLLWKI